MNTMLPALRVWIAALWWGSLSAVGFWVVPMLFACLPSKAIAGNMAAQLFSAQTWVGVVCGLLLLLQGRTPQQPDAPARMPAALPYVLGGMLLALMSEFVVAPHIVAREQLPLWHSLGTLLYVLQWLCAGVAFRKSWPKQASGPL